MVARNVVVRLSHNKPVPIPVRFRAPPDRRFVKVGSNPTVRVKFFLLDFFFWYFLTTRERCECLSTFWGFLSSSNVGIPFYRFVSVISVRSLAKSMTDERAPRGAFRTSTFPIAILLKYLYFHSPNLYLSNLLS